MKKITLLLLLITYSGFGQEISINPDNGMYEYTEIVDQPRTVDSLKETMNNLNYTDIEVNTNSIKGSSVITSSVNWLPVQIFYDAVISVKDSKYRIKISNLVGKDEKKSYNYEGMKGHKKKWQKKFNEQLPYIISKLKKEVTNNDDW